MHTEPVSEESIQKKLHRLKLDAGFSEYISLTEKYLELGRLSDAEETVNQGVSLYKARCLKTVELGRVLAAEGQWGEAALLFEQALAMSSCDRDALKGLTRLHVLDGHVQRAKEYLDRLYDINGDHGDLEELSELVEQMVPVEVETDISSDIPVTLTLAKLYEDQGDTGRALEIYQILLREEPHNNSLLDAIARLRPATAVSVQTDPVLARLENWLVQIRKRRAHV